MRILPNCCAAIALHLCALPLAAQEGGPTDSVDPQEELTLDSGTLAMLPIDPESPPAVTQETQQNAREQTLRNESRTGSMKPA
jgi:hypothetical protein